jgi:hypothetical protein
VIGLIMSYGLLDRLDEAKGIATEMIASGVTKNRPVGVTSKPAS